MAATTSRPGVVLVHGAFHVPEHFDALASGLRDRGYNVNAGGTVRYVLITGTPDSPLLTADSGHCQGSVSSRQRNHIMVVCSFLKFIRL